MRILFLSHYFPPEVNAPASRTFEHCRLWVKAGHDVTVITCNPNHPKGRVYPGYQNRVFFKEIHDGVRVIRLWTYITANEGFLKRTLSYISYLIAVTFYIPFSPKADIVISTSPQFFNGLAGYLFSRLKRIPWILEVRDLWPESIIVVGAIKNRLLINLLEWLEVFAYRRCDHLVPVTCSFKSYMLSKGISADKISVVKNGVDLSFYRTKASNMDSLPNTIRAIEGKFVVAYVGTHGMAHHLETVLQAAHLLTAEPDIVFLMVGEGSERNKLIELKDKLNLQNILIVGQFEKAQMPGVWQVADISLVLLKKNELFKTVIPSKIFESMAMEKPIILGVEGESQAIIEQAECGYVIEPQNSSQLAEKVKLLYEDAHLYNDAAKNGRKYVSKFFDRRKLAIDYLSILSSIVCDKT